jgi:signal transduction histidine kinase
VVGILIFIIAVINFLLYRYKKRAETTIRESGEKYRQLVDERMKRSKLESIGMLAGGIAHDFNNLLGVIMGYIELGKMGLPPDSPHMNSLSKADRAIMKARDLAQQFLTFSEGGTPLKRVTSLRGIVKKVVDHILSHPDLHPKIINCLEETDIKINIPPDLWMIDCDPDQITQVISHLIINSAEAMHTQLTAAANDNEDSSKQKGPIEIIAENMIIESQRFGFLQPGKYIRLSISDRGEGIKPENLSKIFDPYFSTRDRVNQKGLGLGLTLVYSIIKRHNGHIEVNSQIGKGTTVTIYLPALDKRI